MSHPDYLSGRWRLVDTRMPVRTIVSVHRAGWDLDEINRQYGGLDLTAEELAACLAWPFPPLHGGPLLEFDSGDETLRCVCGEWIDAAVDVPTDGVRLACAWCGLHWVVRVEVVGSRVVQSATGDSRGPDAAT